MKIHGRILRDGHLSDYLFLMTWMDFFAICGSGNEGARVFDEIPDRDTAVWNVLILCYVRNGGTRNVFSLFDVMQRPKNGCKPYNATCLVLLQESAQLCRLSFGERVHDYVEEHGYGKSIKICNSLITMYARCRCVDKAIRAIRVFRGILLKDVVTWTALITRLAINGQGRDAIESFTEMQRRGVYPDVQMFIGVCLIGTYICSSNRGCDSSSDAAFGLTIVGVEQASFLLHFQ
ncbi:hypothetical protein GIB67_017098, partial [Kingdonia uniflora]